MKIYSTDFAIIRPKINKKNSSFNINRASPKRKRNDDGINEKEGEKEALNNYSPSSPSILCPSFGNDDTSPIFGFDNDCFDIDNEVLNNY